MKELAIVIGKDAGPFFNPQFPSQLSAVGGLTLQNILRWGLGLILAVAVLLAFFFFLIGGLKWILSQGDKKQVESAQKTILYAIIGLVVIFLSFFIINLLGFAFGVNLLQVKF